VFEPPLLSKARAPSPIAVFADPVVSDAREEIPTPVLLLPEVWLLRE
jgi:hypothetical protein